jgi:hypothetical protein
MPNMYEQVLELNILFRNIISEFHAVITLMFLNCKKLFLALCMNSHHRIFFMHSKSVLFVVKESFSFEPKILTVGYQFFTPNLFIC